MRLEKSENQKKKVDMTYYYLRALCNKKLDHFERAREDYEYPLSDTGSL